MLSSTTKNRMNRYIDRTMDSECIIDMNDSILEMKQEGIKAKFP
jgi:hypothetical protein